MNGYLEVVGESSGKIPVDTRTAVYRDPTAGQAVVAEREDAVSQLGVSDVTVSRKKDGIAPVVFIPQSESIEIRNNRNSNGLVVSTQGDEQEIENGFSARVNRDAQIELGYQTTLRLTVEREAREEYVIQGDVETEGDVVMGDQQTTNVDKRTSVEDVVAKDLTISEDSPADVRDAVVNKMTLGDTDTDQRTTQNFCDIHQMTYSGDTCPKCDSEATATASATHTSPPQAPSETDASETKFCMFCGEEIPARARVCPDCGKELPNS